MKKIVLLSGVIALALLSSCNSLRIDKRHYNKGWYVDFGTERKAEGVAVVSDQEETTEVGTLPVEEQSTTTPISLDGTQNTAQHLPGNISGEQPALVLESEEAPTTGENSETTTPQNENENTQINNIPAPDQVAPAGDDQVLLVILAIFIPPLAVYLVQGVSTIFWITLLFWLFGGAFLFGGFGYQYIGGLGLVAIILALLVVFGKL